jgi:xylulokinase
VYSSFEEAFKGLKMIRFEEPDKTKAEQYSTAYSSWLQHVGKQV